ncbi:MAG: DUF4011 domain-containing protein [Armatimonadota bacterium]
MSNISTIIPALSLSASEKVSDKIASWKASLLDLTVRNPLVALPEQGVVDLPSPNDVFEPLLRRRKPLIFWDIQNKALDRMVLRETGNDPARSSAWNTFRHLHLQALSLLQGQDVNALYVVFGVLCWSDPETGEKVRSPLLLVPATLERRPDGTAYSILRSQEEDVEMNPVLAHRLAQPDTGIILPPVPEESYLIPSAYLRKVASLIEDRPGWEIEERACLGLFPLLKMRLYEDLVAQEARAKGHPLVAAMAGDHSALLRLPSVSLPSLAEAGESGSVEEQHLLLDADPAQQRAVIAASQGQSFVLQGPPGTGKTQTITNIISECIAANKSVLLVSSRMASLDAVLRRLSDKGLGDLCLAAHSLKTSKSDILAQLEQGLTVPASKVSSKVSKKDLEVLDDLRSDLNTFVRELHQIRLPLGISVYQANGFITENEASLEAAGIEPLAIDVEEVASVSDSQRQAMEDLILRMAANPLLADAAGSGIWNAAFADPGRSDLAAQTRGTLESGLTSLTQIEEAATELGNRIMLEAPSDLQGVETLLTVLRSIESLPHLELSWLTQDLSMLQADIERVVVLRQQLEAFNRRRDALGELYDLSLIDTDHADLRNRLTAHPEQLLCPLLGEQWQSEASLRFDSLIKVLAELEQGAKELYTAFAALATSCGVELDESNDGKQRLYRIAQRASEVLSPTISWFTPGTIPHLMKQMDEVRAQWLTVGQLRDDLFRAYSEQVMELDHRSLLEVMRNQPSGLSRLINTAGMRAAGTIKSVTLPGVSTKDRDVLRDMESALRLKDMLRVLQSRETILKATYGVYYQGAATRWDLLHDALQKAEALGGEFGEETERVPSSLAALLVQGDEGIDRLKQEQSAIAALLAGMHSCWEELTQQVLPGSLPEPQSSLLSIAAWCGSLTTALTDYKAAYDGVLARRNSNEEIEPVPVQDLLKGLDSAQCLYQDRAEITASAEALREICGDRLFQGMDTDWDLAFHGIKSAEQIRIAFGQDKTLPQELAERLVNAEGCAALAAASEESLNLQAAGDLYRSFLGSLQELFTTAYLTDTLGIAPFDAVRFSDLKVWLSLRFDQCDQVGQEAHIQSLRDECASAGLAGLFDALRNAVRAGRTEVQVPETLQSLFRVQLYRQWVEAITVHSSVLGQFMGEEQEKSILRFRDLDRKYLDAAPGRIREMTRARAPKLYPDEVKELKGQLARRRTGEVRKLLAAIPNLLFALKPCVMMNPLSVRLFLDADAVPFDVVLFDDASQIATEDAIGAILRGSQVIIAGDPKQLPPLSLVQATTSGSEVSAEAPIPSAFESVLDAACHVAGSASTRFCNYSLNWHYRSQNESLIAFSRRYFYPSLVSFPSAQVSGGALSHIAVSDSKDEVQNESTERVLDVALDYKRRYPSRSIGVITLTESDYARLLDAYERRKEEDPETIAPLLIDTGTAGDEGAEVFFIKMIENVQGDERDLILLHVGADPSEFTSLLQPGSDRLLNVATTRARCDMVVISALSPAFAAVASADNGGREVEGIRMLSDFLQYAQNPDSLLTNTREPASTQDAFVTALHTALKGKGYELREGVGLSDYRVDLAIIDPAHPDRYLLGIECDGPVYAATETARHRDRLCAEMLNQRGWNLHRVWSLDWNRDANRQLKRIAAAVKAATAAA